MKTNKTTFTVIIPARYASSRLPGKPLADIVGKPMIQHVWEKAQQAGANRVIVATDNEEVAKVVTDFGGEVCMTAINHNSGTERLAEVVEKLNIADNEIIVNIQGDEPLIPPVIVSQVAENLAKYQVNMATLAVKITDTEELFNPNAVKVLTDKDGYVLYFSRAVIPWNRDQFAPLVEKKVTLEQIQLQDHYLRHIGIYAYRAGFIKQYVQWQPSALENIESLEQLRVLWYGEKIHVELAKEVPAVGVDTQADLEKVRSILS
ncbi:3-deoxy-manno-octulosonate cytidylyltransferase (CMP-KDO synthetase) [Bisgaardia hudsonensis]|uniref:3-deoxy-manno-octulosonate cytidylyltransferase n=1 Tax=Bisgaardia hudsonensis TaxID=109472 RepID=A0A4R2N041_9PAST|nr:3-deoxy-manno-octulosonate cytidylyltransferase [Bisgaardia hudsonensis]QLB13319.1 3-deoxy-manno-octulosonate cytidylyltransferase [Bisgaardia hudsonensis]TCP12719.1 3-deoxy-manno-octulosonate cytidylyltransferase (CMP-KDO synthetase) [Bisgaardia hudsonensis]